MEVMIPPDSLSLPFVSNKRKPDPYDFHVVGALVGPGIFDFG